MANILLIVLWIMIITMMILIWDSCKRHQKIDKLHRKANEHLQNAYKVRENAEKLLKINEKIATELEAKRCRLGLE